MENKDQILLVADLNTLSVWTMAKTPEEAEEGLQRAIENQKHGIETYTSYIVDYPDNADYWKKQLAVTTKKKYKIMEYDYFKGEERKKLLKGKPKKTTKEKFWEMLEVLPPIKWCTIDGVEMFCMSEMWTGSYTSQYAHDKKTDKYYTKMVDCLDKSTWIHEFLKVMA